MSSIATAIVGSAVIGGVASYASGKAASKSAAQGADAAAAAQIESTRMQIDEIQRQFDYQQNILQPLVQQQYNAGAAYMNLLGVTGPAPGQNPDTGYQETARPLSEQQRINQQDIDDFQGNIDSKTAQIQELEAQMQAELDAAGGAGLSGVVKKQMIRDNYAKQIETLQNDITTYEGMIAEVNARPTDEARIAQDAAARGPVYPGAATTTQYGQGGIGGSQAPGGGFYDPNLNQMRLADSATLYNQVQGTLQAGTGPEQDPYRNYIAQNQLAAGTAAEDARVQRADQVRAAGTSLADDPFRQDVAARSLEAGVTGDQLSSRIGQRSIADDYAQRSVTDQYGQRSVADDFAQRSAAEGVGQRSIYDNVSSRSLAGGAGGTGVYGAEFEASPGYAFQVEEMGRELDRRNSAGGNYGGRAIMEAQRRAQGLAKGDYYNWAAGRTRDLERQAAAESMDATRLDSAYATDVGRMDTAQYRDISRMDQAGLTDTQRMDYANLTDVQRMDYAGGTDISRYDTADMTDVARGDQARMTDAARLDTAGYNYLDRVNQDIARGDLALSQYEGQRTTDVARGDDAYQNYLMRLQGDAARLDTAASQRDALMATDLQRQDQGYYNYLANLSAAAGIGAGAQQAVQSSQAAGGQIANAYAQQGGNLASIYNQEGVNQANIQQNMGANINNAFQSGVENWITYKGT
jgi:hypothetical protein